MGPNGSNNKPLKGQKGDVYEGGVRVPFLVQWKGRLPADRVFLDPVIQLDILPTAVAAAGGEVAKDWKLDGVNLLPFLAAKDSPPPHEMLCWRFGPQWAIRKGDWKLVQGYDYAEEKQTAPPQSLKVEVTPKLYNLARHSVPGPVSIDNRLTASSAGWAARPAPPSRRSRPCRPPAWP